MSVELRNVVNNDINNSDHSIESENITGNEAPDIDLTSARQNRVDRPQ